MSDKGVEVDVLVSELVAVRWCGRRRPVMITATKPKTQYVSSEL